MKKKKYLLPTVATTEVCFHPIMGDGSIRGVNGTAGLNRGDDNEVPIEAGSRRSSLWNDETDE